MVNIAIIGRIDQLFCECSVVSKKVTIAVARDTSFIRDHFRYDSSASYQRPFANIWLRKWKRMC